MTKYILNTRPLEQSDSLRRALDSLNIKCINLPAINITGINTRIPNQAADIIIFTSQNAVLHCPNAILAHCATAKILAPGEQTAKLLQSKNIAIEALPDDYSSAGLLALPLLDQNPTHVWIITGKDSKPLLQQTLLSRGYTVEEIVCYQRTCPSYSKTEIDTVCGQNYRALVITSSHALTNLLSIFKGPATDWLYAQQLVLLHDNISHTAKRLGFKHLLTAKQATEAALIQAIQGLTHGH